MFESLHCIVSMLIKLRKSIDKSVPSKEVLTVFGKRKWSIYIKQTDRRRGYNTSKHGMLCFRKSQSCGQFRRDSQNSTNSLNGPTKDGLNQKKNSRNKISNRMTKPKFKRNRKKTTRKR